MNIQVDKAEGVLCTIGMAFAGLPDTITRVRRGRWRVERLFVPSTKDTFLIRFRPFRNDEKAKGVLRQGCSTSKRIVHILTALHKDAASEQALWCFHVRHCSGVQLSSVPEHDRFEQ